MIDLAATVHARLDAIEASIKADRNALHIKVEALLKGLHHLLSRDSDMSQITDTLNGLATTISSTAVDNATKTTTLIGYKDENDSALSEAVTSLQTASDAMKSTGSDLDKAIAAHTAGTIGEAPAAAVTVDPATGLPVSG